MRRAALSIGAALALAVIGCEDDPPPPHGRAGENAERFSASPAASPESGVATLEDTEPRPAASCAAPSLGHAEPLDATEERALERCPSLPRVSVQQTVECGLGAKDGAVALEALDHAVLAFDAETLEHVRAIVARGRTVGRRATVFGLVGDSMTVSWAYLRSFTAGYEAHVKLAPEVESALATPVGGKQGRTIIDFYRGVRAQELDGAWRDSFIAPRAAKVGASAPWALAGGTVAPLRTMIRELSPAVAIVLYGGNDAALSAASIAEIASQFEANLGAIVDELEKAGVVPVLNTLARHGHMPGIDDCGPPSELTNWRVAVQTNALSARVARMACARRLPLVDLRHALDAAPSHGLAHDGVHPTAHAGGAGKLTRAGLTCGYNIRNYVTLRMLRQIKELVLDVAPP